MTAVDSQTRQPLSTATQMTAANAIASLISQQFATEAYTANFTIDVNLDRFPVDSSGDDITVTVPAPADLIVGKPYIVEKVDASNEVTIHFLGSSPPSDVVLAADGDMYAFVVRQDGTIGNAFPAPLADAVPAGALAIAENLADLDDAPTALTNLGGTTVGKAVFTAVDAAAARTAIGAPAASAVDLKADTHTFGPFTLSLVGTDADEIRFQPGFAGTITGVLGSQTKGTVATGAATATLTKGGSAPTSNTITHSIGHAAGQKTTMSPTGGNCVFAATDEIRLAVTGTNDGAGTQAAYTIQYTRS